MTRSAKTSMAHTALLATGFISIVLLTALFMFIYWSEHQALSVDRLEYYKLYLAAFQVLVIGFGVALLGILIPAIFAEARYNFEV
ncbi:MAG: hypothetical protein H0U18_12575 [Pyrinomonadaceae bacterium]|nr:hypothetical protein [Pyrinomonadaceae bacterium]